MSRRENRGRRRFLQQIPQAIAGAGALASALWRRTSPLVHAAEGDGADKKLGFALVGLGSLAEHQIAPALLKTKHCRLAGLVSGHPDKAKRWAKQYGVPEQSIYSYDTYDQIANNDQIDVVYVVLPNSMHAEYTIRAAKAGKHVLCEKPMAVSSAECQQMIDACRDAKRMLAIGYRLHFDPYHREMIRLAREKTYGALRVIQAGFGFVSGDPNQWRLKKSLAGGGALMDVGIYALQATRYLTGEEPIRVSAAETKTDPVKFREVDESIGFQLTFPGNVLAICDTSYNASFNYVKAIAAKGWFQLDPAYSYTDLGGVTSDKRELKFDPSDQFAAEMDDFAQCIQANRPSSVSGEEGLRDLRILEAVYRSIAESKTIKLG